MGFVIENYVEKIMITATTTIIIIIIILIIKQLYRPHSNSYLQVTPISKKVDLDYNKE